MSLVQVLIFFLPFLFYLYNLQKFDYRKTHLVKVIFGSMSVISYSCFLLVRNKIMCEGDSVFRKRKLNIFAGNFDTTFVFLSLFFFFFFFFFFRFG